MNELRAYLNALAPSEQEKFAIRCGTSVGYLRKAISTRQMLREGLCIRIEQASNGVVLLEALRPDVDWAYLEDRACVDVESSKPKPPPALTSQARVATEHVAQGVAHA